MSSLYIDIYDIDIRVFFVKALSFFVRNHILYFIKISFAIKIDEKIRYMQRCFELIYNKK